MEIRVVVEALELVQVLNRLCSLLEDKQEVKAEKPPEAGPVGLQPEVRMEKPQSQPKPETVVEEKPVATTYEAAEVRAALGSLGKTHGKETAKKLLSDFGANKFSDLKPEQYAGIMAEIGGYF